VLIPVTGDAGTNQPQVLIPDTNPSVGQAQVLIPVTGADLSEKSNERQALLSRVRQTQGGLNFLALGLLLMGITLMGSKKKEDEQKED
jgi:hypothetical protein